MIFVSRENIAIVNYFPSEKYDNTGTDPRIWRTSGICTSPSMVSIAQNTQT